METTTLGEQSAIPGLLPPLCDDSIQELLTATASFSQPEAVVCRREASLGIGIASGQWSQQQQLRLRYMTFKMVHTRHLSVQEQCP